jgi:succinyl-CoA synthetase alpha subunit
MGHAGAIVTGSYGSYGSKRAALERAGVLVVDTPREIPDALFSLRSIVDKTREPLPG